MKTKIIAKVNNADIIASSDSRYVAVKPICEALGINHEAQYEKIKDHPILSPLVKMIKTTSRDGKRYKMFCLPLDHILIWLLSINFRNVQTGSRRAVLVTQMELYYTIFRRIQLTAPLQERIAADSDRLKEIADQEGRIRSLGRELEDEKRRLIELKSFYG